MRLGFINLYKQNPIEKLVIFTIYQNYTLALTGITKKLEEGFDMNYYMLGVCD